MPYSDVEGAVMLVAEVVVLSMVITDVAVVLLVDYSCDHLEN